MGISYNPLVVTDGLVLYLDAANSRSYPGSGSTWNDLSGYGNDGIFGGSTAAPTYIGDNGGCISFDGDNDLITILNDTSLKPVSAMTIESFCYIENNSDTWASLIQYPYLSTSHSNPYFEWGLYLNMSSRFLHSRINGTTVSSNYSVWNFNEWSHLVLSYSSSVVSFYVNGAYVGGGGVASSISYDNPNNNILVGRNASAGERFEGRIGSLKIYDNKSLSSDEVIQNFNATKGRYGV